jgi:hypothetical protein
VNLSFTVRPGENPVLPVTLVPREDDEDDDHDPDHH